MAERAARNLPTQPDWGDPVEPIRCPRCGKMLAVRQLGRVVVRHAGRTVVGATALPCPRGGCGGCWRAESLDAAS